MKTQILRALVRFRVALKKISNSTAFKLLRKLVILFLTIRFVQLNCQKMDAFLEMDVYAITVYIVIMFAVVLQLIAPKLFKPKHDKVFKWLRILNIAIVFLLVYTKWHCDGYVGEETVMLVLLELGLEFTQELLH